MSAPRLPSCRGNRAHTSSRHSRRRSASRRPTIGGCMRKGRRERRLASERQRELADHPMKVLHHIALLPVVPYQLTLLRVSATNIGTGVWFQSRRLGQRQSGQLSPMAAKTSLTAATASSADNPGSGSSYAASMARSQAWGSHFLYNVRGRRIRELHLPPTKWKQPTPR
jgi:hypothetical protein